MPLFEFICKKCNENFETLVLDGENIECPKCHGREVSKLFSRFASTLSSSNCAASDFCPSPSAKKHKCSNNCCCHK